jgi:hypothetical protein
MPLSLKRKIVERLKPFIDRFSYRDAVDAALRGESRAKTPEREREPS